MQNQWHCPHTHIHIKDERPTDHGQSTLLYLSHRIESKQILHPEKRHMFASGVSLDFDDCTNMLNRPLRLRGMIARSSSQSFDQRDSHPIFIHRLGVKTDDHIRRGVLSGIIGMVVPSQCIGQVFEIRAPSTEEVRGDNQKRHARNNHRRFGLKDVNAHDGFRNTGS